MMNPIEHWRLTKSRYQLEGVQCSACSKVFYPRIYQCPCGSREFICKKMTGKGKILSFTEITASTRLFKNAVPYCLALIALEDGPNILAQMADVSFSDLVIGLPVRSVFRRYVADGQDGLIYYGTKFVIDR